MKSEEFATAIRFLTFHLFNFLFFKKLSHKIWQFRKKPLPLHPQNEKSRCDGGVAQLVRASDS